MTADYDGDQYGSWEPTPDMMLGDIRYLVRLWEQRPTGLSGLEVAQLVDAIDMLDDHMSKGGVRPRLWRDGKPRPRVRTIENLPPL